ncbi:glycosyltransferase family 2 protein [Desulfoprunum benzoelyticum]|uniref:Glycosyltransferase involved in cell wall biosynthesis n=1 Tax=Desulfoprunum benzoelyticum TaxID=1506996 RepID=A0A840UPF6_9BACT|nr:glycosyltransferase family A protein [Desulfoprunum benzoelyticum]MBB5346443.1 glycosyltransferase involved in cell wall biosynthesis [Desulfoprunum benzoelyticum]MBM9528559.1 glycosyltransferase family 2 protein [Desulfoprunum benzoelyticum]
MQSRILPVSVIVPTYNRRDLLLRALRSVSRQSVRCEEVVVVDDASTDGSRELVESCFDRGATPAIRWFRLPSNRGPAAARNFGIRQARCETIAFLDSDDHWQPQKLERQAGTMERFPEYLISHTRERWLRRGHRINQKYRHIPRHGDIFSHCLELCAVGMSTVMVRRGIFAAIGLLDEGMRCCEDYDFWLRVSCRYPFLLVDEELTIKEGGREDQLSHQHRVGMDRLRIHSLLRLLQSGALNGEQQRQTLQQLRQKCEIYGKGCRKHGKEQEGRRYLALAAMISAADDKGWTL